MPERSRRLRAAAGAGLLALVLAGPAALAQTDQVPDDDVPSDEVPREEAPRQDDDRWAASEFDAPFDEPDTMVRTQPFDVTGTLRYEKIGPADHIVHAEVRVVPDHDEDLAEGCTLPDPVVVPGQGPGTELTAELRFEVYGLEVACNGRYLLEVEGTLDDPAAPRHTLRQTVALGSLPPAVTDLAVDLDEQARQVSVTFTPLADDQLDPDSLGYVLERGGPADGVATGSYHDVATIDLDDEPRFTDDLSRAAGGTYTYRVRSLRAGAEEPERSSVVDTESSTVTIGDPPDTPPTTARATVDRPRRGSVSVSRRSPSTTRRVTVTTLDTGFEDTIDYGDLPPGATTTTDEVPGDEPLAGQSIIQDEADGQGLVTPVAGALVLLGWAGHIAYVNRLAKQLSPGP